MEPATTSGYEPEEPTREEVERMPGPVLFNFGTNWCGYCRALQPALAALLAEYAEVRHIKVEDGKGKPLGRSFGVKLWPTLVFLRDGQVVSQISRPEIKDVRKGLEGITSS
jgi:thioredoxin 1